MPVTNHHRHTDHRYGLRTARFLALLTHSYEFSHAPKGLGSRRYGCNARHGLMRPHPKNPISHRSPNVPSPSGGGAEQSEAEGASDGRNPQYATPTTARGYAWLDSSHCSPIAAGERVVV